MGDTRKAESGVVSVSRDVSVTVPVLAAGASADVVLAADAAFKQATCVGVDVRGATMLAGLEGLSAFVSDPTTGVVTVRCFADAAGCAGGAQLARVYQQF